jgi:hypothetical protein
MNEIERRTAPALQWSDENEKEQPGVIMLTMREVLTGSADRRPV